MTRDDERRSLFIVSLPRSLSTRVYRLARDSTGLAGPSWAASGEILNHDLLAMSRWPKLLPTSHKYVVPEHAPERAASLHAYLDDVTRPVGRVYKDVVQPFVVRSWPGLSQFAVLRIRRDLADVAHAVLEQGWHYPKNAVPPDDRTRRTVAARIASSHAWDMLAQRAMRRRTHARLTSRLCRTAILAGLVLAESALADMPGVEVRFDDLVRDEGALPRALAALYSDPPLRAVRYIDEAFRTRREQAQRRLSPARRAVLTAAIDRVRAEIA